jgi:hypothetical protein
VHFDVHMNETCTDVGRNLTHETVHRILDRVRPDYIQIDCKGHYGLASYPTRVGSPAPGFEQDPLRIWREATAERGVALYMHYSGVWDAQALRENPEWACWDADAKPDENHASLFGPYVRERLIPQLIELAEDYGVDGVWVDGDCWAVQVDYRPEALAAFREATGLERIPRDPAEEGFQAYLDFCREGFRRYLRTYVDAVHARCPGFQIASNWAFSSYMPEPVSAEVDFLSGDYSMINSIHTARLEARALTRQHENWDLMAWGFAGPTDPQAFTAKPAVQLMQEAAQVLAQGGGFQVYYRQKADTTIHDWQMEAMGRVAEFCRARQKACHRGRAIPQVAVLLGTEDFRLRVNRPFRYTPEWIAPVRGTLFALLDSGYAVELLGEHHLAGRLQEYPLVVLPQTRHLAPGFREELLAYVRGGGTLLVIGADAAAAFAGELDVTPHAGGAVEQAVRFLEADGRLAAYLGRYLPVDPGPRAEALGAARMDNDFQAERETVATVAELGRGRIAGIYADLGDSYAACRTAEMRTFLGSVARSLFAEPLVELRGEGRVDVACQRTAEGLLAVHLLNLNGPHGDRTVHTYDCIPPAGPLEVSIRLDAPPRAIRRVPGNRKRKFRYENGFATIELRRLEIHEILLVEEG